MGDEVNLKAAADLLLGAANAVANVATNDNPTLRHLVMETRALQLGLKGDGLGVLGTGADLALSLGADPHVSKALSAAASGARLLKGLDGVVSHHGPGTASAAPQKPEVELSDAQLADPPGPSLADTPESRPLPTEPTLPTIEAPELSPGAPGELDDANRLFRLYTALPTDKRLYVQSLSGREAVCAPFEFSLQLVSLNASIKLNDVLNQPLAIAVAQTSSGVERYIHGYVGRFTFESADGGLGTYHAQLLPWTSFLMQRLNKRIFQKKTIREIADIVFVEYGPAALYEFRLQGNYRPHDYITQYQDGGESDYDFLTRLFAKEGWTFFFEHRVDGHRLVITDDTLNRAFCPPLPLNDTIEFCAAQGGTTRKSVTSLQAVRELQPGKVSMNTYDYQNPRGMLGVEVPTHATNSPMLEVYDGASGFAYDNADEGRRYAQLRMEAFEAHAKKFVGTSECADLRPGYTFLLSGHFRLDAPATEQDRLLLLEVTHRGRNNLPTKLGAAEQAAAYTNGFVCIRSKIPYRSIFDPKRWPVIHGPLTAAVTGPPGEEIWTNDRGCIKVRFHWDRYNKYDDTSSCWIRVAQLGAGPHGNGSTVFPRVNEEAIVVFLGGNPDRPLVVASVPNHDNPLPRDLPAEAHKVGLRGVSMPGGDRSSYSALTFHTLKGKEKVSLRAQKDMVTAVKNNHSTVVMGPQQTIEVTTGSQSTKVKKAISFESQTESFQALAHTAIDLNAETQGISMKAKTNVAVTAEGDIVLQTGKSKLIMSPDGIITLEGVHVSIKGSSRVDLNP